MVDRDSSFDKIGKTPDVFRLILLIQIITIVPFLLITKLDRNNELFIQFIILPISGYLVTIYLLESNKLGEANFKNNKFWIYTIFIRILILFLPIGLSDDIYRYLWEGHLQHQGVNPYLFSPDSPELIGHRTNWWERVNNPDIQSPYPPLAQLIFLVVTFVTTDLSLLVIIFRIMMVIFDLGIIVIIKRLLVILKLPERRIMIYAWSPLVLFEISGNAHVDVVAIFFLLLSIFFILRLPHFQHYQIYSGISLALAFLVKFFPIVILPFLIMKWGIKGILSFLGTVLTFTLFYFESGINPLYPEGLMIFAKYFRFNESIFRVYRHFLLHQFNIEKADMVARTHYIIVMLVISFWILILFYYNQKKSKALTDVNLSITNSIRSYQLIIFSALLLGPDIQPWYLLWLLPFTVLFFDWAIITMSVTVLLSYQIYPEYDKNQIWQENHWILLAEYVIIYTILATRFMKRFVKKSPNIENTHSEFNV